MATNAVVVQYLGTSANIVSYGPTYRGQKTIAKSLIRNGLPPAADTIEAHLDELPPDEREWWAAQIPYWRHCGEFFQRGRQP
jgi:hypothetical protein